MNKIIKRPIRHNAKGHGCKKTQMTDEKHTNLVVTGVKEIHKFFATMAQKYKDDDHCSIDYLSWMIEMADFISTLIIDQMVLTTKNDFKPDHFLSLFTILAKNQGVEIQLQEVIKGSDALH